MNPEDTLTEIDFQSLPDPGPLDSDPQSDLSVDGLGESILGRIMGVFSGR